MTDFSCRFAEPKHSQLTIHTKRKLGSFPFFVKKHANQDAAMLNDIHMMHGLLHKSYLNSEVLQGKSTHEDILQEHSKIDEKLGLQVWSDARANSIAVKSD